MPGLRVVLWTSAVLASSFWEISKTDRSWDICKTDRRTSAQADLRSASIWESSSDLVSFSETSIAYDNNLKSSISSELPGRIRMTNKGIRGTFKYFPPLKTKYYFRVLISLFSRKILRWFSPYLLLISFLFSFIYQNESIINSLIFFIFIFGLFITLISFIFYYLKINYKILNVFLSFFVANLGFFICLISCKNSLS